MAGKLFVSIPHAQPHALLNNQNKQKVHTDTPSYTALLHANVRMRFYRSTILVFSHLPL